VVCIISSKGPNVVVFFYFVLFISYKHANNSALWYPSLIQRNDRIHIFNTEQFVRRGATFEQYYFYFCYNYDYIFNSSSSSSSSSSIPFRIVSIDFFVISRSKVSLKSSAFFFSPWFSRKETTATRKK
jgi:hypothetical protein